MWNCFEMTQRPSWPLVSVLIQVVAYWRRSWCVMKHNAPDKKAKHRAAACLHSLLIPHQCISISNYLSSIVWELLKSSFRNHFTNCKNQFKLLINLRTYYAPTSVQRRHGKCATHNIKLTHFLVFVFLSVCLKGLSLGLELPGQLKDRSFECSTLPLSLNRCICLF